MLLLLLLHAMTKLKTPPFVHRLDLPHFVILDDFCLYYSYCRHCLITMNTRPSLVTAPARACIPQKWLGTRPW